MKLANKILSNFNESELLDLKLDPTFFTKENKLDPKVIKVLKAVLADVMAKLKKQKVIFEPAGVILTGSLTSVNYDEGSDVDFHVLVDFSQFPDPDLMRNFLTYFAKNFNGKFDLRGRDLELYFQDANEPHISPGIYDILNDTWLMPPSGEKIEKTKEMQDAAANHKLRAKAFAKDWAKIDKKNKVDVNRFLSIITHYFEGIRTMRKEGLATGGLASVGNQVFKLLRRNGTLELITKLMHEAQDEIFDA